MALTVFDAVGKFHADTSELDQFITKLERNLPDASSRAAAATKALKDAQLEFRDAIKAVNIEGGNTAVNLDRLAQAEKNLSLASQASQIEHKNLKTSLGAVTDAAEKSGHGFGSMRAQIGLLDNTMRGNFTYAIADVVRGLSQFGFVSAVLPWAAMAAGLVLAGGLWGKLSEQVKEYLDHEKDVEQAIKDMGLVEMQTFRDIGDEILREQIKIDEFTGNHLKALQEELELIDHSSMKELEHTFDDLQKKADETFKAMRSGWLGVLLGASNEGLEEAQKQLDDFVKKYNDLLKGGDKTGAASALTAQMYTAHEELKKFREDQAKIAAEVAAAQANEGTEGAAFLQTLLRQKATLDSQVQGYEFLIERLKTMVTVEGQISTLEQKRDENAKHSKSSSSPDAVLQNQITFGNAAIELLKQQTLLRLNTEESGYRLESDAQKQAFAEQLSAIADLELQKLAAAGKAANDEYQLQIRTKQAQLDELKKSGKDTVQEQTKINAEIETLQFKHQATILATWNKAMDALRSTMSVPIPLITEIPPEFDKVSDEVTKAFEKAGEAAKVLGITLHSDLNEKLQGAYDAYDKLTQLLKKGAVTDQDVRNGYIALVKAELDFAKATNASADSVAKLQKELNELNGTSGKTEHVLDRLFKRMHVDIPSASKDINVLGQSLVEMESIATTALGGFAQAFTGALQSAIMAQQTFGQAMEQATAQVLAQISAQATVYGLYYLAHGIADLFWNPARASADFAAAAEFFAVAAATGIAGHALAKDASSTYAPGQRQGTEANGAAGSAGSTPTATVNAPRVASGGIAISPVFAMIGDSPSDDSAAEAILPLGDRRSMHMIAEAIMPGVQQVAASAISGGTGVRGAASASRDSFSSMVHDVQVGVTIKSDTPQLVKEINRGVATKRLKLRATNSDRLTRTS